MGDRTFRGGVHPEEMKELSCEKPLIPYTPVGDLVFLTSQHIGKPATPVVKKGDRVLAGASGRPVGTPYHDPRNPDILQGARGLSIDGIALHRHFVALSYRADSLPHVGVMTKD